jgi:hypothetical protein
MRLSPLALLASIATAGATTACAGTVSPGEAGDAEAITTTSAVVAIERSSDTTEGSRAEASARFLRVTFPASGDDALRAIGAALDLPAPGTCAAISLRTGETPAPQTASDLSHLSIELVDVGGVTVEAAGVETKLSPRQLPDVTDIVRGVVYSRATDPALLPAGARYVVRVAGQAAGGLDAFEVSASAPGDPGEVRIGGEDETGTVGASGPTLELSWTRGGGDDVVYLDVQPTGVRCVLADGGHATSANSPNSPASATVSTIFLDDTGSLVVHRLHREAMHTRGVDSGEVRFDFSRTVTYVRR